MDPNVLRIILPLLAIMESGGDPNAIGDGGAARGILQIHPVMVREVNRIVGEDRYTLADRVDPNASCAMASVYLNYWGPRRLRRAKGLSVEDQVVLLGRLWNGGPNGHKKAATARYGRKLRRLYHNHRRAHLGGHKGAKPCRQS